MEAHPTACLWGETAHNLGLCAVCACLVAQLCLTLQSPGLLGRVWNCYIHHSSPLGYSVPGVLQARILEWVCRDQISESICLLLASSVTVPCPSPPELFI